MADAAEIRALMADAAGCAAALMTLVQTYRTRLDAIDSRRQLAEMQSVARAAEIEALNAQYSAYAEKIAESSAKIDRQREHNEELIREYGQTVRRYAARVLSDACDPWFKVNQGQWSSASYAAIARVAAKGISELHVAAQRAITRSAGFKPSDPAEPEPAVHVPKPVPPSPLTGAELHEVAVHAADSMDVPRYVGRYFDARRQVGRLLDAPLA